MSSPADKPPPGPEPVVADAGALAATPPKIRLNCSFCHGPAKRTQLVFCAACLGPHHLECFREHGRCSLPGCEHPHLVQSTPALPREANSGLRVGVLLTVGLLACGVVSLAVARARANHQHAAQLERARFETRQLEAERERNALRVQQAEQEAWGEALKRRATEAAAQETARELVEKELELGRKRAELLQSNRKGRVDSLDSRGWVELNQKDPSLRTLLDEIAKVSRRRIVLDPTYGQELTTSVQVTRKSSTWHQMLEEAARQTGLTIYEPDATTLVVGQPRRVTLVAYGASLRDALTEIARQSGRSLELGAGVSGRVTLDLCDVPWDAALESVAASHDLHLNAQELALHVSAAPPPPGSEFEIRGIDGWALPPPAKRILSEPLTLPSSTATETDCERALNTLRPHIPARVSIQGDLSRIHLRNRHNTAKTWEEALDRLRDRAGLWTDLEGGFLHVRAAEPNQRLANATPVVPWLMGLARAEGLSLVVSPEVRGFVTPSRSTQSYRASIASAANALGLRVEHDGPKLIRIGPPTPGSPAPAQPTVRGDPNHVRVGSSAVRFSGMIQTPRLTLAIVGDRAYEVGESLHASTSPTPLWAVESITPEGVRLIDLNGVGPTTTLRLE